jgi:hypothetical protein
MEKTVKVVSQTPVFEIEVTDAYSQQKKRLPVVEMMLTDGLDTFVAEMRGERCRELTDLVGYVCRVSVTLNTRSVKGQDGRDRTFNSITLNRIARL